MIYLNLGVGYKLILLFLFGAIWGKVLTLYGYGKLSHLLKLRIKNITTTINRVIGVLLVCVSVFQFAKLVYF